MGFFTKWFGSNNDGDQEQKEVKQLSLNIDHIQQPHDLPEAFRYIAEKWGADFIQDRRALNVLNDFQVLKEIPAAKHIIMNMQTNGYIQKISQISNWKIEAKSITVNYSNTFGVKEDVVLYLVQCIGYGFQLCNKKPLFVSKDNSTLFHSAKQENEMVEASTPTNESLTINNSPLSASSNLISLDIYDPKMDLPNYRYPRFDLLIQDYAPKSYLDKDTLNIKRDNIVSIFENIGLEISYIQLTEGPMIMFYEVGLAPGIRISRVHNVEEDIMMSLGGNGVRVITPIPGTTNIGIEVPQESPHRLSIASIFNTMTFGGTKMELPCAIGYNSKKEVFMFDLAKAPHLLVAGGIGQGKSTCLNCIITSLLYKKHPSELKLVLIDPKRLEFSDYSVIKNHFLAKILSSASNAVIADAPDAVRTLRSLCKEMESRQNIIRMAHVRNIEEYNRKFVARQLNPSLGYRYLPSIVVVIDEFGDLIHQFGKEAEMVIANLLESARTIGIHMILATQYCSNNVITDIIRERIYSRIAFKTWTDKESKLIINSSDANYLSGPGDMFYLNNNVLTRVQGAFIEYSEIDNVAQYIAKQESYSSVFELVDPDHVEYVTPEVDMTHLDPLFDDAARLIVMNQSGSTSIIQRKFAIGYNRANRLMDQLEKAGIVGAAYGSRPREVLIHDEYSLNNLLSALR